MHIRLDRWFIIATLVLPTALIGEVFASETPATPSKGDVEISMAADPMRYSFVSGDASKFRALHWMNDGLATGVDEFKLSKELSDGVTVESEGRAISEDGDYGALMHLRKEDVGYINFDFDQFRKYFPQEGGVYTPYPEGFTSFYTDKTLAMDIGKFGVEAGLTLKNLPEVVLNYEREYKRGTKSRLTWGSAYTGAFDKTSALSTSVQKKLTPAWEETHEITDSFGAKLSDTFLGINWKADQQWEYMRARKMRQDDVRSAETVNAASTLPGSHLQNQDYFHEPGMDRITTVLGLDRWFMKDKVFASSGYRFSQVDSRELLNIIALDKNGEPVFNAASSASGAASTTNTRDSFSDNHFVSQTLVGSMMTTLFNPLTAISRFKAESIHRNGASTMRQEVYAKGAAPDGIIDTNFVSDNQEKVMRYGESFSLRYSGIPRVAFYNDYDFEQTRNNISQFRTTAPTATTSDAFTNDRLDHQYRGSGTLGMQYVPWNQMTMTLQGRYREDDIHYFNSLFIKDPLVTGNPSTTAAKWLDGQRIRTDEASAKVAWKPVRWFQPSFRYQLVDKANRAEGYPNSDVTIDTALISNVYTYDVVSQPMDDLLMTASFSYTDGKVITPVRFVDYAAGANFQLPAFNYDVYTSLFSAELALSKDVVLTGTADYTRAANYQDISVDTVPYGADFHEVDVTMGLCWTPKKDWTIEPKYAYYQYQANEAEVGNFKAHVVSFEVKSKWG